MAARCTFYTPYIAASGDYVFTDVPLAVFDRPGATIANIPNAFAAASEPILVDGTLFVVDVTGNLNAYALGA